MDLRYKIILAALLLINIVAFAAYGIDKRKAKKDKWRPPARPCRLAHLSWGGVSAGLVNKFC